MNRDITSIYKAYARSNRLHPILLVSATFDSGVLRFWNGYSTLSYDGNDYTGAGNLLNITSSTETEELKANGISIGLSGISTEIISIALNQPVAGRPVDIKMGFLSGDPQEILNYNITVSSGLYYVEQEQKPKIYVIRGQTYRFDQSDSSNNTHNLRISRTSNGTYSGGVQYTDGFTEVGTAGTAGAYNQWVVPKLSTATTNYAITVVATGSGNKFYVDGSLQTSLTLQEGQTYRFTQSNASNDGHPLFISTNNSSTLGTFQSGYLTSGIIYYIDGASTFSNYTNTTTFNAGTTRYIEFTPDSITTVYIGCYVHGYSMGFPLYMLSKTIFYYYCQNHSGMGGEINVSEDFVLFEPFTLFDGQMDKMEIQDNGETSNVSIVCESKLITLQTPRIRRYTLEDQKIDHANDLGLEFIPSLQDKEITWGRG